MRHLPFNVQFKLVCRVASVPPVPVEDAYVNDAPNQGRPFVATTYTDHSNSRALYVFGYGQNAANLTSSFRPADFGISSNAYVYDYFAATRRS